ncbi:MAG TPA: hypothetical protein VGH28_03910 [Polyangiaceae bacterium]|jgi:hypothetical protein
MPKYVPLLELSDAERNCGFDVSQTASGTKIVARKIADDLLAVKMHDSDGRIAYVVCDPNLEPIYIAATSLGELRERLIG